MSTTLFSLRIVMEIALSDYGAAITSAGTSYGRTEDIADISIKYEGKNYTVTIKEEK